MTGGKRTRKGREMKKQILLCDLDDVLNCFGDYWIPIYNEKSGDNLTVDRITDWNLSRFVLPEWKEKIFSKEIVLQDGFFLNIPIKEYAVEFMEYCCQRLETYIVSASYPETVNDKAKWIMRNFPFFDIKRFIPCYDKFMIKGDLMVDDGVHNLETFDGLGLLMDRPWNRRHNKHARFYDLREVVEWLENYCSGKGSMKSEHTANNKHR